MKLIQGIFKTLLVLIILSVGLPAVISILLLILPFAITVGFSFVVCNGFNNEHWKEKPLVALAMFFGAIYTLVIWLGTDQFLIFVEKSFALLDSI